MARNLYPYGLVKRLAQGAGISTTWASKVLNNHELPSLQVAMRIDATGLVKGRSIVAEVLSATAQRVA